MTGPRWMRTRPSRAGSRARVQPRGHRAARRVRQLVEPVSDTHPHLLANRLALAEPRRARPQAAAAWADRPRRSPAVELRQVARRLCRQRGLERATADLRGGHRAEQSHRPGDRPGPSPQRGGPHQSRPQAPHLCRRLGAELGEVARRPADSCHQPAGRADRDHRTLLDRRVRPGIRPARDPARRQVRPGPRGSRGDDQPLHHLL